MNGSDHLFPQPRLGRVVAEANDLQDELVFEVTSLPDYLAAAPTEGLERWNGELRSGFRSNMLMGVTSNRVDVKRLGALAERALERRAEPLAALFQTADQWPHELLALAWKEMVRNSAHDSICACSVDDVVDAVLHRYAEARTIASGLADRAVASFARSLAEPGNYILNAVQRTRAGLVELVVGAEDPPSGDVQVVSERTGLPGSMVLDANTVRTVLGMLQGPKIDNDAWVHDVSVEEDDQGLNITVTVGAEERPNVADIRSEAGHLCPPGSAARRRHPRQPEPAPYPTNRGPGQRCSRLRLADLRPLPPDQPGPGEPARRACHRDQWSRHGGGR